MKVIKKILNFLKKNIFLTIMSLFVLIGAIIILVVMFKFFINGNNEYGKRLEGIEEVEISKKDMNKIADTIEEKEEVASASVRLQGKIIYLTIKYNEGISLDQAKQVATSTLENFSTEELEFYDLGYFLTSDGENNFNITGSKKAKKESISFIKS